MRHKVETYKDLRQWVKTFHKGVLDLLIIEGSAGSGKTSMIKNSLSDVALSEYAWISGRATAIHIYEQAWYNRDIPMFLDDVDDLFLEKKSVELLKQLCQTEEEKLISWRTKTNRLEPDVPRSFTTKSKVCIITNAWNTVNKHVKAVEDRGVVVSFQPTHEEIHARAITAQLADEEIYNFMAAHMLHNKVPSLRHYVNAKRLKDSALINWQEVLLESFELSPLETLVLELNLDSRISQREKSRRFANETGRSISTYWRLKDELLGAKK